MNKNNPTKDTIYTTIKALSGILFTASVAIAVQSIRMKLTPTFYGATGISAILAISNIFQMLNVLFHKNRHNKIQDEIKHYDYYKRITVFAAITLPISFIILMFTTFFMAQE